MQPSPVGGVFFGLGEFRQRQIGAVFRNQRFAPQLQRIGEMRTLLVCQRELRDGFVRIAFDKQHLAPLRVRLWQRRRALSHDGKPTPGL